MTGRPTRYTPEQAEQARLAYELGFTDEEVARLLRVHLATLYRWRERHPEFAEAGSAGKRDADNRVQLAMYRRAIGYDCAETRAFLPHCSTQPVTIAVSRHVPADTRLGLHWLRIRCPDEWAERPPASGMDMLAERLQEALDRVAAAEAASDLQRLVAGPEAQSVAPR